MNFRQSIAISLLALTTGGAHAWTLVYATDASGNISFGTLQAIRNAASIGSSIKIIQTANGHEFQINCNQVSMHTGTTQEVVCISTADLYTRGDTNAQFGTAIAPPQSLHYRINTRGQYTHTTLLHGSGTIQSVVQAVYPIRWYAQ